MTTFIRGALTMSGFVAALFFFRFFWLTRERLFLFFSASFSLQAIAWCALAFGDEELPPIYAVRPAFVLIIVGVDKNRARARALPARQPSP